MSKRQTIINTVKDLVADFLYYDRKEDEALGRGDIDKAVRENEITADEIVDLFSTELRNGLQP